MHGFLNINKAPGMTSFEVLKKIQKLMPKTKLGHLGTLDPMAEGVLPVAVGHATRLIEYMENNRKIYRAVMTLGGVSDTQDAWGRVEPTGRSRYDEQTLQGILAEFTGTIMQVPPMYSAVHHQGKRLYELARQGIEVERSSRKIEIMSLCVLDRGEDAQGQPVIAIEVQCSPGTYIRTLCHDIGQRLGTGAYMSQLIRIASGLFAIGDALNLEELEQVKDNLAARLMPLDYPLRNWPVVILESAEDIARVSNGNHIVIPADLPAGMIRIYHPGGRLMAVAQTISESGYRLAQPLKVFK